MNRMQSNPLLRRTARRPKPELDISRRTHDVCSRRLATLAVSDLSHNDGPLVTAKLAPARKARSGPGRRPRTLRQHRHQGPRPRQPIFPESSVRQSGPVFLDFGGRRVPSPPKPPSTLSLFPWVRRTVWSQKLKRPTLETDRQVAQNLTTRKPLMTPKPAKPDHRVWRRSRITWRTNSPKMTGPHLTRSIASIY